MPFDPRTERWTEPDPEPTPAHDSPGQSDEAVEAAQKAKDEAAIVQGEYPDHIEASEATHGSHEQPSEVPTQEASESGDATSEGSDTEKRGLFGRKKKSKESE